MTHDSDTMSHDTDTMSKRYGAHLCDGHSSVLPKCSLDVAHNSALPKYALYGPHNSALPKYALYGPLTLNCQNMLYMVL